jgi:hypothetical protein
VTPHGGRLRDDVVAEDASGPAVRRRVVDRMLTVVVLPDSFGPSRPTTPPAGTSNDSPARATTSP